MAEPYIYAQLLREGTSDDGLESILQATLIDVGGGQSRLRYYSSSLPSR